MLGHRQWEQVHPNTGMDQPVLMGSAWVLEGDMPFLLLPLRIPDPGEAVS